MTVQCKGEWYWGKAKKQKKNWAIKWVFVNDRIVSKVVELLSPEGLSMPTWNIEVVFLLLVLESVGDQSLQCDKGTDYICI